MSAGTEPPSAATSADQDTGHSNQTKLPKVGFIILSWNQRQMTLECLDSVMKQDYPAFSVLVVDNGSTDGSPDAIRAHFPQVEVLELGQNVGYSAGNNVGMMHLLKRDYSYVFLLNNDTFVDPHMLRQLVEVAESDLRIGMVGPIMYFADLPTMIWAGYNRIDWRHAHMVRQGQGQLEEQVGLPSEAFLDVDNVDTCAILVRRQVIERIGMLDTRYFINLDDVDWSVRAHQAGFRVVYVPHARIWHRVSASMGFASPATTYYMTRNALLFFWTRAPGLWKIAAVAQIIWRTVWIIGAWTLKRRYRNDLFRRKRDANVLALRDFFLRRFGQMGADVAKVCYG